MPHLLTTSQCMFVLVEVESQASTAFVLLNAGSDFKSNG